MALVVPVALPLLRIQQPVMSVLLVAIQRWEACSRHTGLLVALAVFLRLLAGQAAGEVVALALLLERPGANRALALPEMAAQKASAAGLVVPVKLAG